MLINDAVIAYLVEFHCTRDYFECHEILEEYWKTTPKDNYSELWVALIQVAVGQYHDRRGNLNGAKRMYASAISKLRPYREQINELDLDKLIKDIDNRLLQMNLPFVDLNIVINSEALQKACLAKTSEQWGIQSSEVDITIIDKHKLRDRTDVIKQRALALQKKKNV